MNYRPTTFIADSLNQAQEQSFYLTSVVMPRHRERHHRYSAEYLLDRASWLLQDVQHVLAARRLNSGKLQLRLLIGPLTSNRLFDFLEAIEGEHDTEFRQFDAQDAYGAINCFVEAVYSDYHGDYAQQTEDPEAPWAVAGRRAVAVWQAECRAQEARHDADAREVNARYTARRQAEEALTELVRDYLGEAHPDGRPAGAFSSSAAYQLQQESPKGAGNSELAALRRAVGDQMLNQLNSQDYGQADRELYAISNAAFHSGIGLLAGRYAHPVGPGGQATEYILLRPLPGQDYFVCTPEEFQSLQAQARKTAAAAE